ncbi:hypothetical protein Tco_0050202, partial [Tanacetum coccineum]
MSARTQADTESEPIEAPESPYPVVSPTSLPNSTPPTCHVEESEGSDTTARMAVRVPPAMSPGLFANMAEMAAMSDSAFRKRFRSSYESSPSTSPPDLPSRKRYRGTSELVEDEEEEDDEEEGDDKEEDEEMEESLDSYSVSEGAEDEGPTAEDEDPAGRGSCSLVVETAMDEPLGLGYGALRRREIALGEGRMPSVFEVGQSSGSVPESERPEIVSALRQ